LRKLDLGKRRRPGEKLRKKRSMLSKKDKIHNNLHLLAELKQNHFYLI
jgi:hypothetical protein